VASKPDHGWRPAVAEVPPAHHSGPSKRLRCLHWQDVAGRTAEWDRLAEDACEPNPFFESWYLLPALRAFPDQRVRILCYEEEGRLRGLLPVHFRRRYYGWPIPHLSNWLHDNCFLGVPLVAKGSEVAFWQAMLGWADGHPRLSLFLHLQTITIGGPVHAALTGAVAADARKMELVLREQRALLQSELPARRYWEASVSAKKRKELRRQAKRLAELGELAFERSIGPEGLERWSEDFLALEAGRAKPDRRSPRPRRPPRYSARASPARPPPGSSRG
jgi:CelD/BcsL family acetyltransferase involved in cellulose biosynthesis